MIKETIDKYSGDDEYDEALEYVLDNFFTKDGKFGFGLVKDWCRETLVDCQYVTKGIFLEMVLDSHFGDYSEWETWMLKEKEQIQHEWNEYNGGKPLKQLSECEKYLKGL